MNGMVSRPRHGLSLCAGGGGLDLGVMLAEPGYHTRAFVEWEDWPRAVLVAAQRAGYFAPAPIWTDLRSFDARPFHGAFDAILAGYPCQPFSAAGKRSGADDPRHLWPDVARVIHECRPEWVFLENVAGHLTLGLETVLRELWGLGYTPAAGLFSAAEVGAPHERLRIFILAHTDEPASRQSATFRLPPSRLALDPADVIWLAHDGREVEFRLVSVADAEARGIEAVRQDRSAYDLPPGDPRPASLASPVVFGTPEVVMLDLPQTSEDQPAHRPLIAANASPWPGEIAVFRSASTDGFNLLTTLGSRARLGTLAFDFFPGPTSRFDLGNALVVDLLSGTLESVTDVALFGGANAVVAEAAAGQWEIVQAGQAELIAPGRYRLTRLLRGQRGTEYAMGNPAPAGARVVVLDTSLASLPIAEADLGLPWNWRVGPAARAVSDASYAALGFTPTGRGLVPFAPVHVEQPWRVARSPGDLTIRWTRRSRALVADAWEQVEVPLAEDLESYDIQILDGAAVKRTLTSSTTSVLYTAAQQTADWGAPLGPGQILAIRIFQLSNRLGRGTPATVTLQF